MEWKKAETDQDFERMAALASEVWHEHFTPIIGQAQVEYMLSEFLSPDAIKRAVSEGYDFRLIMDDHLCERGLIAFRLEESRVFISKFYLKKEARGQGLATAILERIKAIARANDKGAIYLTCNKNNVKSLAVYRHWGFRETDSFVKDIGKGFVMDDYVMTLQLDGKEN